MAVTIFLDIQGHKNNNLRSIYFFVAACSTMPQPTERGGGLESRWHQCWEFEMARLGAFIGGLCLFFSFESRPEADGSCCYVRLVGMIL